MANETKDVKKYLFIPDWSKDNYDEEEKLADKVIKEFMRSSFLTGSTLYLLIDQERFLLLKHWSWKMKIVSDSCKLEIILKNKFPIEVLMKNMDCFIAGNNYSGERQFVEQAWLNKLEIVNATTALSAKTGGGERERDWDIRFAANFC